MYLIVGLGNPGMSYRKTRHNVGFLSLDLLASRANIKIKSKGFSALYGEGFLHGERVILVKPQTYMNNSGDCVQQILHFYKLDPSRLIVLYDDIDLPVGSLRIRSSGTGGSHNGMRSILACIHSEAFPRIRIGIGKDDSLLLRDYVLKRPSKDEQALLAESFAHAADAAEMIVAGQIEKAQALYNKKHEASQSESIDNSKTKPQE